MDSGRFPRILRWLLPPDFVERVVEPAFDDLRAEAYEQGQREVRRPTVARFVISCVIAAVPAPLRRPRIVGVTLTVLLLAALTIVRLRLAY